MQVVKKRTNRMEREEENVKGAKDEGVEMFRKYMVKTKVLGLERS
jgi:hypothetical protein